MTETVTWRKSSYSGSNSDCVEVAVGETIGVRDTKDRASGELSFTWGAWTAVRDRIRQTR